MSSGKVHSGITATAAGIMSIWMWRAGYSFEHIKLVAQGCLAGIFLSPDLDVDAGFIGYFYLRKYFGEIVATCWRILWWPYAMVISHRSWMSHAPLVSTGMRLLYWYTIYAGCSLLFNYDVWIPTRDQFVYSVTGLMVSDVLHYLADILSTYLKKRHKHARVQFPVSEMQTGNRSKSRFRPTTPKKSQRVRG